MGDKKTKPNHCVDCGGEICKVSVRCHSCAIKHLYKENKGPGWKKGEHGSFVTEFQKGHKLGLGRKFTSKHRENLRLSHLGHIPTEEARKKASESGKKSNNRGRFKKGHKLCVGCKATEATKIKLRNAHLGKKQTPETIAKRSAAQYKGGRAVASAKNKAKRRLLRFIELNEPFEGCVGHHLDFEFVGYIPEEMHRSVSHSVLRDRNMGKINTLALDFIYGD